MAVAYRSGWAVIDLETRRVVAFTVGREKAVTRARIWARHEHGKGKLGRHTICSIDCLVLPKGDERE